MTMLSHVDMRYAGARDETIKIFPADSVDAEYFYSEFIARRQPVVLRSSNAEFLAEAFSNEALAAAAGNEPVQVEDRRVAEFGSTDVGKRKYVKFADDFLACLKDGHFYLTTQDIPECNGIPEDFAPPLVRRFLDAGLVPFALPIAGKLIPDQINCWMGFASKTASSSGFHHDFHDNLYFVVRGQKTFKILSPDWILKGVQTHGSQSSMVIVHPNGVISYEGDEFREDGASKQEVLQWRATKDLAAAEELEEVLLDYALRKPILKTTAPPSFCLDRHAPVNAQQVVLSPGDILYLPAGYFHEVLSLNGPDNSGHLVFNYWYHPPTFGAPADSPYTDNFWAARMELIRKGIERREAKALASLDSKRKRRFSRIAWMVKPRPLSAFFSRKSIKKFLFRKSIK